MAAKTEAQSTGTTPSGSDDLPACTSAFDALWFCYSPGNQFKKYYRDGNYDDCDKFHRMFELCMKHRWLEVNGKAESDSAKEAIAEMKALSTKATANHVWRMKQMVDAADRDVGGLAPSIPAAGTGSGAGGRTDDTPTSASGWSSWLNPWGGGKK
mmetsp:Transcript_23638/g.36938  ORF Transcript_23638/g.36938 Transcript_23638/m.36938 type:complete len:155 (-) Transcript_23638:76-540(-)|eukprot:CAMPEP_0184307088 /NCGR_PEP_ID=MMETSP1049-20130417/15925_1 /TAXON_ID=77928 /ORGANISM="Proteomonas sulcata, Strain CCMP704" /LENGTH=154 /DNA_ID=CAMNT_0026619491 /DNA_START=312 /DNA_END=776 /DNA_ORIENTATION=+